ncbi:hypothetical protein EVAR_71393_1 [Eumeta japonica]|uniref:Uncharacterized protein n=1 Tax=Eumeta variegata TaxID=151549 RepID=A0A4C2AA04_EUMVA|nr:hypothetical protein EVAR_71393_1 [Eumeta japonica]
MEHSFLAADPPPRADLAAEYFNAFSQICDEYRGEEASDVVGDLRASSESLRLTSEIIGGVRQSPESLRLATDLIGGCVRPETGEFVNTDFISIGAKDDHVFQFGQPDAAALLRQRARRRYREEHGVPPLPQTSQESGVSGLLDIAVYGYY